MIKAVILDMDGLLIDSEPIWEEAEVLAFKKVGVPITLEMTRQTMGFRVDEVVQYWFARYPWEKVTQKEIESKIVNKVIELVIKKGVSRKGVKELIALIKSSNLPIAIASSSQTEIINAVLNKLGIRKEIKVIHSAEHEPYGKPHPAVFITAAKKLGVLPQSCLVFEDSPNGVLAAKSAKMKCIAVPDKVTKDDKRLFIADKIINSLLDFTKADLDNL